jgi:hypothetical protein
MELVRYRPGEAIRWLQTGAENIRRDAREKGKSVVGQTGTDQKTFGENLKTAASAVFEFGRGAYAELKHRQAEANEFVLHDKHVDIVRNGMIKTISYDLVKSVEMQGDRGTLVLEKGTVSIKPFAHIVAGKAKVPVGWTRNGIEVPYELLIEELAARCGVDIEIK